MSEYDPKGPKDEVLYIGVYVVPLLPKNISRGDNISEHEEWFVPFENDLEPATVQDEQVWAINNYKFAYNALPITNALPYVPLSMLTDQREGFASNIMCSETQYDAPTSTFSLPKGYKIPPQESSVI